MDFINFINVPLTPKESNFIGQIGADLLIRTGEVPSNTRILREIIKRAMMVKGTDVPTVEAKPVVHGEWIENTVGYYVCSNCRQLAKGDMTGCFKDRKFRQERTDFCPWCGADMRGGKNE